MFAEYEKAQLAERDRRGKAGGQERSVTCCPAPRPATATSGRPRNRVPLRVVPHQAVLVSETFRCYADEGAAIADLRRC